MAPTRKSKSVNKRFTNEASPEIYVGSSSKTKQRKKKLTDKLGPQWTKGELQRFYDAYRKHGAQWKKVAAAVRNNRSVDMVEALFNMNRAYLSLPEGTASVAGLIAMMIDHYSVIVRKERRAARKRTPRFPVSVTYQRDDRECSIPSNKRAKKQLDAIDDDDEGHILALAMAATRRLELSDGTPIRLGKMSQAKEAQSKYCDSSMFEDGMRISCGKRHKKGASDRDDALLDMEVSRKGEKLRFEEAEGNDSDASAVACSANEGLRAKPQKGNKKLLYRDDELDALEALAELASAPLAGLMESELAAQLKEERIANNMDENNIPETTSTSHHREKANQAGPKDILLHEISAGDNRRPKSAQASVDGNSVSIREPSRRKRKLKVLDGEAPTDSMPDISIYTKESAEDENMKTVVKTRRPGQGPVKQQKTAKTLEESFTTSDKKKTGQDAMESATQVPCLDSASLPQKPPNRRKMSLKKSLQERANPSETTHDKPHSYELPSEHELLKEKVSTFLSNPLARRRCIYEWFYSAIDYPWFAKMEFIDYLNHVGLAHVPRLTRLEWSVIKSSLGRPRRFSERFIQEEQDKLKQYRESVRNHYTELRTGAKEGLPTDLARPLSVGNRIIAIHPRTREIRDGKILTVDHNKCNVMFDELGIELVMDTDCMPLNPLEYMPERLRRQTDKCLSIYKEAQHNKHPNSDASVLFPSVLDNVSFPMNPHAKQASYSVTEKEEAGNMVQQALSSIGEHEALDNSIVHHGMKHQELTNGSLDDHGSRSPSNTVEPMVNGFISQDGSGKNETKMSSELISSCVATWLMIQMCTEKQYPPADVAQVMDTAVSRLQPRCPQNMPIYREIQTCMGWIKTQIMALVKT
ncbi:unnamed protein product [Arabis nemorensis]|uniref:DIRP domain-containing protein n=1 Tax=Arabis nemorensis TaxID=586526 RepID=A0A565CNN3_9BRAS|nr:unnamed protein product [Arabis nemorensis]